MGKKLKYFVMGALCLLGLVTAGNSGQTVKAADAAAAGAEQQKVVLTKFGFEKGQTPGFGDKATCQTPNDATSSWAVNAKRVAGVEFSVYDITENFWKLAGEKNVVAGGKEGQQQEIDEEALYKDAAKNLGTAVATGVTNAEGQISFQLDKTKTTTRGTNRAVYLFKETKGSTLSGVGEIQR